MASPRTPVDTTTTDGLASRYRAVRDTTVRLCDPLSAEDMTVQAQACASPTKWHLAHTTWFFETFILREFAESYTPFDERFAVLFNSYYRGVGPQHPRAWRGLLTRPGLGEVMAYRDVVDDKIRDLLKQRMDDRRLVDLIMLGLHHEQQHQELLLTDIKLLFHTNPTLPVYRDDLAPPLTAPPREPSWVSFEGGVTEIGNDERSFCYDNETPRHRRFLEPFELASRPVSNREFAEFIEEEGYTRHELWLDEGWTWITDREGGKRDHPMYWSRDPDGRWIEYTLAGPKPLDPATPVSHLSFFEADAFARWSQARLPTEVEWEHAVQGQPAQGNFLESDRLHPSASDASDLSQCFGDVWEWTRSSHEPYPGYAPPSGALGEYNGKFMCNSFVLRGGSCLTSGSHIRATYRNFLEPRARWQCAGLRLARSAS